MRRRQRRLQGLLIKTGGKKPSGDSIHLSHLYTEIITLCSKQLTQLNAVDPITSPAINFYYQDVLKWHHISHAPDYSESWVLALPNSSPPSFAFPVSYAHWHLYQSMLSGKRKMLWDRRRKGNLKVLSQASTIRPPSSETSWR